VGLGLLQVSFVQGSSLTLVIFRAGSHQVHTTFGSVAIQEGFMLLFIACNMRMQAIDGAQETDLQYIHKQSKYKT